MTANDSKSYRGSYISYFNKKVDKYNNTDHFSVGKKPIHADYSALLEESEGNHKALKFKVGDRSQITNYKNNISNAVTEKWS